MNGRIIHVGHECAPPPASNHTKGTIWLCDCGRYSRNLGPMWHVVSPFEIAMMRTLGQLQRELDRQPKDER